MMDEFLRISESVFRGSRSSTSQNRPKTASVPADQEHRAQLKKVTKKCASVSGGGSTSSLATPTTGAQPATTPDAKTDQTWTAWFFGEEKKSEPASASDPPKESSTGGVSQKDAKSKSDASNSSSGAQAGADDGMHPGLIVLLVCVAVALIAVLVLVICKCCCAKPHFPPPHPMLASPAGPWASVRPKGFSGFWPSKNHGGLSRMSNKSNFLRSVRRLSGAGQSYTKSGGRSRADSKRIDDDCDSFRSWW